MNPCPKPRARRTVEGVLPAHDSEEWILLPGLFSWDEVWALFSARTGHDPEWRFAVCPAFLEGASVPLYSVRAARRP